jgi:ubiquinone/menaquinone biosynthesis C-methylase UbiE
MQSEADAWHERNVGKIVESDTLETLASDPVLLALCEAKHIPIGGMHVFEIGCGNGYRLAAIRDHWFLECYGCDLSKAAIEDGVRRYGTENLHIGWREAKNLKGIPTEGFDMVIYGFCLYACDPADLFQIAREGDRILKDGGYLVIYDFLPDHPHSRNYKYDRALRTYKHDYSKLWLAHPSYTIAHQRVFAHEDGEEINHDTRVAVTILKKNVEGGFPLEP